jgi:D-alanyl-D-alanine carboxypeptidase
VITLAGPTQLAATHTPAKVAAAAPTPTPTPPPPPQLCLVSPLRSVPLSYVPPDLVKLPESAFVGPAVLMRREAADALNALIQGAASQQIYLYAVSGYRSSAQQQETLDREIKLYGSAKAHSEVALPGHSEHQLGVAVDVLSQRDKVDMDDSFGSTPEGRWLVANAPAYGFVISYPKDKEPITGYIYEPWHIRYVGSPLAQQITATGLTLTEYLPLYHMDGCDVGGAATASPTPAAGLGPR